MRWKERNGSNLWTCSPSHAAYTPLTWKVVGRLAVVQASSVGDAQDNSGCLKRSTVALLTGFLEDQRLGATGGQESGVRVQGRKRAAAPRARGPHHT